PTRRGEHVDAADVELRMVTSAAHALLLQLIEDRLQHLRPIAEALHAERALGLDVAYPLASLLGGGQRLLRDQEGEWKNAGRRDLVAFAPARFTGAPLDTVAAAGIANGGDAVAHPELVDIFGGNALLAAPDVTVHVDEAGQDVVAAQIDLAAAGLELGPARIQLGAARRTHGHDIYDAIAFDDDIRRAEGGRAG